MGGDGFVISSKLKRPSNGAPEARLETSPPGMVGAHHGRVVNGGQVPGRKDRKALGRIRRDLHAGGVLPDGTSIVLPGMPMTSSS